MAITLRFRSLCFTAFAVLCAVGLSGCYLPTLSMKRDTATRLAAPSFMLERQIATDPYLITVYERTSRRKGGEATVYIEGGPIVWNDLMKEREAATPQNPVALHMATRDKAESLIYMARPCQYTTHTDGTACERTEWTTGRFSLEALRSMNAALDNIKKEYGFTGFNLVGYADGAGIAVHMAASRRDILSLRTVAGVIDTDVFAQTYNPEQYEVFVDRSSQNPAMHAAALSNLPQHHFVGEWDHYVGPEMAQNFRYAAGNSRCVRVSEVKAVNTDKGWVNRWPDLLKQPLDCRAD